MEEEKKVVKKPVRPKGSRSAPPPEQDPMAELLLHGARYAAIYRNRERVLRYFEKALDGRDTYHIERLMEKWENRILRAKSFDEGRPVWEIDGYTKTIARNLVKDHFRRKETRMTVELDKPIGSEETRRQIAISDPGIEGRLEAAEEAADRLDRMKEALEKLPPKQRAAMEMFYYEEMNCAQIAAALGISENAAGLLLFYGRIALRAALGVKKSIKKKNTKKGKEGTSDER